MAKKRNRSAYLQKWRKENPDKIAGYQEKTKEWYEKNKDEVNAKTVKRRQTAKGRKKYNEYQKEYRLRKKEEARRKAENDKGK